MVKKWWLLCFLSMAAGIANVKAQQQEFNYTQYMDNLVPFNQASSMLDKGGSVNLLARKQYVGIPGSPSTFIFNGNLPLGSINAAAGLLVLNDQFAVEHNTQISAFFAKSIQLGDADYLAVSLSAGVKKYVADFSSLDPADPQFRDDVRETRPNLGFGLLYYSSNYYLGLSMPELSITGLGTASVQNSNNFRNHYYFSGAFLATLDDDFKFKPATLVSYSNGQHIAADISGILYIKELLGIGVNYNTRKAAAGILSVNTNTFRLGYSYQFSISSNNLGGLNNATHEVTLTFRFGKDLISPKLL